MSKFRYLIGAATLAFSSNAAFAQCSDVLKDGTMQVQRFKNSVYFEQAILSRFSEMNYSESKKEQMAGLDIPIGEYIMGRSNYNSSDFNKRKKQISISLFSNTRRTTTLDYALASGDEGILKAWSACMSGPHLSLYFERFGATDATMTIEWHIGNTQILSTKLKHDVTLDGVEIRSGKDCLVKGRKLTNGAPCEVRIRLPSAETTLLAVATSRNGSAKAFLPAFMKVERQRQSYEIVTKRECRGTPPEASGNQWQRWARRCPERLHGRAKRQTRDYRYNVSLKPELAKAGWYFSPKGTNAQISRHYGSGNNKCIRKFMSISDLNFTYGYTASGRGDRNASVFCNALPTATIERYALVPAG